MGPPAARDRVVDGPSAAVHVALHRCDRRAAATTGEITLKPKPDADALQAFFGELQSLPASDEFVPPCDDAARTDPLADWSA